ncbi:MAG: hypothetical protein DRI30_04515 [Chloroflexi bacterium]|nr:MAG: hypothetical protein DRI30_04515 [Chloroflexota bacterium]
MKKLLTMVVISLSLSGFAFADDGNVPEFKSTMGQPYDGTVLGRAGHPEPTPTINIEAVASELGSVQDALDANS